MFILNEQAGSDSGKEQTLRETRLERELMLIGVIPDSENINKLTLFGRYPYPVQITFIALYTIHLTP